MIIDPNDHPDMPGGQVIDLETGFALDVPLGLQMPPAYWEENPHTAARILTLREANGIAVPNDFLLVPEMAKDDTEHKPVDRTKVRPRQRTTKGPMKRYAR